MRFLASYWRIYNNTLKFQKLFILFVAAALNFQIRIKGIFFQHFTRIIQHFCEEIRMSLGTMELI